jgi:hypothetical protein
MATDPTNTQPGLGPSGLPAGSGYACSIIEGGNPCPNHGTTLIHLGPDMLMAVCAQHESRLDLHMAHIEWERRPQP